VLILSDIYALMYAVIAVSVRDKRHNLHAAAAAAADYRCMMMLMFPFNPLSLAVDQIDSRVYNYVNFTCCFQLDGCACAS